MVEYFKLYKEKDGGLQATYYIPIGKNKNSLLSSHSVKGFVYLGKWEYNDELIEPESWEEIEYSNTSWTKILDIKETPKKRELFKVVFNNEI